MEISGAHSRAHKFTKSAHTHSYHKQPMIPLNNHFPDLLPHTHTHMQTQCVGRTTAERLMGSGSHAHFNE